MRGYDHLKIAIITGASSGLGREYVRQYDKKERFDEIWAVARREEKLEELEEITRCVVRPVSLDLSEKESIEELKNMLEKEKPSVTVLVNAAGFGRIGPCRDIPYTDTDKMIDLNCRAAVDVTSVVLPYMEKGSRILEICSTAAFQPFPGLGVYAATKAFLHSYTKSLHHELLTTGIHVTAVCPYWIKDTEFIEKAKKTDKKGFRHFPLAEKAHTVARWSIFDSDLNLWVSTPGPVCMAHRFIAKFIPHFILVPIFDLMRRL